MSDADDIISTKTRKRKPVERLVAETPQSPQLRRTRQRSTDLSSSKSPTGRGRKRGLENPPEKEAKRAKYSHEEEAPEEEEEEEEEELLVANNPALNPQQTIAEAFSGTEATGSRDPTDALLRQILARLELLRQQHRQTERQIQYIIDESSSSSDLVDLGEEARVVRNETSGYSTLSTELLVNLRAISNLLQRD